MCFQSLAVNCISQLLGKFSNSATTNSKLKVIFLIDEKVSIMLYEYARNHPVSGKNVKHFYKILIKHNGKKINTKFEASNYSDRLTINKKQSEILMGYLKQGGTFQFFIEETGSFGSSTYNFKIDDASGFTNAWQNLYGYIEEAKLNEAKLNEAKLNEAKLNLIIDLEKFASVDSALLRTKRAGVYYKYVVGAIGKEKISDYVAGTKIKVYNIIRKNMVFAGRGDKKGYIYKANLNLPTYFGELLPFSTPPQPLKDLIFKKPIFGQEGTINLKIFVDKSGNVSPNVQLIEDVHYKLNQIAMKKIIKVKFEPAKTKNGDPVGAWIEVSVIFK
tara:strand:+ start:5 stop:997 length:993 start_codon:yes stop_codon:yes gene_type:complete